MTDEQAKELAEIVSKEFREGAIEQLVLMKDQSLKIVTNIKENIKDKGKLDGVLEEEKIKDEALNLACRRIDTLMGNEDSEYVTDPFTFELLAKEELEKERKNGRTN